MTFEQWLDYYCINRAQFAKLLDSTRQSIANWASGDGLPEQYREVLEFVWGRDQVPDTIFADATRGRSGKLIKRGDDLIWLD